MTSTLRRTSSAARSGSRSSFPSAYRYSMRMFFPSTYPSSRSHWRNASTRAERKDATDPSRIPIRGILAVCCAWAEELSAKSKAQSTLLIDVFLIYPLGLVAVGPTPLQGVNNSSSIPASMAKAASASDLSLLTVSGRGIALSIVGPPTPNISRKQRIAKSAAISVNKSCVVNLFTPKDSGCPLEERLINATAKRLRF
jgi:hypothetical protein